MLGHGVSSESMAGAGGACPAQFNDVECHLQAAATREVQPLPPPPKWVPRGPASLGSLVASPVKGAVQSSGPGSYRRGSASFRSSRANSVNSAAGSGPDSDGFGEFMGPDDLRTAIAGARADVAGQRGADGSFTRCRRRRNTASVLSSTHVYKGFKHDRPSKLLSVGGSVHDGDLRPGFRVAFPCRCLLARHPSVLQCNVPDLRQCRAVGSAGRG